MTIRNEAIDYINAAATPEERSSRKAEVFAILYSHNAPRAIKDLTRKQDDKQ